MGLPRGCNGKESAAKAEDTRGVGLIPRSGRSPAVGNGNPLQDSCLENSMDRRAWWTILIIYYLVYSIYLHGMYSIMHSMLCIM